MYGVFFNIFDVTTTTFNISIIPFHAVVAVNLFSSKCVSRENVLHIECVL